MFGHPTTLFVRCLHLLLVQGLTLILHECDDLLHLVEEGVIGIRILIDPLLHSSFELLYILGAEGESVSDVVGVLGDSLGESVESFEEGVIEEGVL